MRRTRTRAAARTKGLGGWRGRGASVAISRRPASSDFERERRTGFVDAPRYARASSSSSSTSSPAAAAAERSGGGGGTAEQGNNGGARRAPNARRGGEGRNGTARCRDEATIVPYDSSLDRETWVSYDVSSFLPIRGQSKREEKEEEGLRSSLRRSRQFFFANPGENRPFPHFLRNVLPERFCHRRDLRLPLFYLSIARTYFMTPVP